jgi:hypothetical protein
LYVADNAGAQRSVEAVVERTTPATLQPFKDIMEPFMQTGGRLLVAYLADVAGIPRRPIEDKKEIRIVQCPLMRGLMLQRRS